MSQYEVSTENAIQMIKKLRWRPDQLHTLASKLSKLIKMAYPYLEPVEQDQMAIQELMAMIQADSTVALALKLQPATTLAECVRLIQKVGKFTSNREVQSVTELAMGNLAEVLQEVVKQQGAITEQHKSLVQQLTQNCPKEDDKPHPPPEIASFVMK